MKFRKVQGYMMADLASCLRFPDDYYLSRGYHPETLQTFEVGTCVHRLPDGKNLLGWSILPVVEHGYASPRLVGYTARNPRWVKDGGEPKWVHGVARGDHLFNFVNAQHSSKPLVICEGPGDAMRWHEAGFPRAVATMGSSLSTEQAASLFSPVDLAPKVYLAADADEAERKFVESVRSRFGGIGRWEVLYPVEGYKDFGDMTPD